MEGCPLSLTIIVGPPGTGKSKAIRDRYLKVAPKAVFFDGHHGEEAVRQLRHEMGFFDHRYLSCTPQGLWPELARIDDEREIFIDMPDLPAADLREIRRLAAEKDWHLTVTARSIPSGLEDAEIIRC